MNKTRPNIILIVAESMDGRKMGCMNDKAAKGLTVNLDRLAEEGTLFNKAYSVFPVCNPARACLWSGRYPHYYSCWNNHEGLRENIPTFKTILEDYGYNTCALGPLDYTYGLHSIRDRVGSWTRSAGIKRPLCTTPLPMIFPDDSDLHIEDENLVDQSIEWIKKAKDGDQPFMLYLTTGLVHPAFNVKKKFFDLVNDDLIDMPPEDTSIHPVLEYIRAVKQANPDCPEGMIRKIRKIYYAMIATLDEMLGSLFEAVKEMGLSDNTYIIFTSDHGEMAMEHGQILKRTMYEPSIHIPLIIKGPDIEEGVKIDHAVSLVDIFPTLMEMAQVVEMPEHDGISLLPGLRGNVGSYPSRAFAQFHADRCNTGVFMLVKDDYKYIKYMGYEAQLFDLRKDPYEINDIAGESNEIVNEMEKMLRDIADCEEIDRQAKEYDKTNFRKWREERIKDGTYEDIMSLVYSGYDRVNIENLKKWTDDDEKLIVEWLNRDD